ncbi:15531_t:CDS:2, partial [Cetraspora pellucida]
RTIDMYTPILHEFTYQAMANDLLKIDNGQKFTYSYVGQDGSSATRDAILDESDTIWVDIRHKHMKDCIDQLMTDFNKFLDENSTITNKDKAANLNDMKKMLATLPQFQDLKDK